MENFMFCAVSEGLEAPCAMYISGSNIIYFCTEKSKRWDKRKVLLGSFIWYVRNIFRKNNTSVCVSEVKKC